MSSSYNRKCQHPGCKCIAPPGQAYCSDFCKTAGNGASGQCACGHGSCDHAIAVMPKLLQESPAV